MASVESTYRQAIPRFAGNITVALMNWEYDSFGLKVGLVVLACSCFFQASQANTNIPQTDGMFFTEPHLTQLRASVETGPAHETWEAIRERASGFIGPAGKSYLDPQSVDRDVTGTFARDLHAKLDDIGFYYLMTGDQTAARHGATVVTAIAEKLPVTHPKLAPRKQLPGYRGDMIRLLAVGYRWFRPAMTAEQRAVVEPVCRDYAEQMYKEGENGFLGKAGDGPYHNYHGVCYGANGLMALALMDVYHARAKEWLRQSVDIVSNWMKAAFDESGAYLEGAAYVGYGTDNVFLLDLALQAAGRARLLPNSPLKNLGLFYAMSLLPDEGVFDARNDADYSSSMRPNFWQGSAVFNDPLMLWLALNTIGPFPQNWRRLAWQPTVRSLAPAEAKLPRSVLFPQRGLAVFRTGWSRDDLMFSIEAGPYFSVIHNQADKGHFSLYGLGHRWAIDSAKGEYASPHHNVVLIDGAGQSLTGMSFGTSGKLEQYGDDAAQGFAYARYDLSEAYRRNNKGIPGPGARRAIRHAVFIYPRGNTPAYAVVLDDIDCDGASHDYTWLLHTESNMVADKSDPHHVIVEPLSASKGAYVSLPNDAKGRHSLTWKDVQVPEAGDFYLWARVRVKREENEKLVRAGSLPVSVNGGPDASWRLETTQQWEWVWLPWSNSPRPERSSDLSDDVHRNVLDKNNHALFANRWHEFNRFSEVHPDEIYHADPLRLNAGSNEIRMKISQPGTEVDEILLTRDASARPPFAGTTFDAMLQAEDAAQNGAGQIVQAPQADARMHLFVDAVAPVTWTEDTHKLHPRLKATAKAVNTYFSAVLVPVKNNMPVPNVTRTDDGRTITLSIKWPDGTDTITWRREVPAPTIKLFTKNNPF